MKIPSPFDCYDNFEEFAKEIGAPKEAEFYGSPSSYSQVKNGLGAKAQIFLELDKGKEPALVIYPAAGGFFRLKHDGTWEMDAAPWAG